MDSEQFKIKEEKKMKKLGVVLVVMMVCSGSMVRAEDAAKNSPGEKQFAKHCAVCHPQGGNIVNPKKTLRKNDLAANNIKTEKDIIKEFRNGVPGMPKFDENAISKADAQEIAQYILKSFK
jgi:cytochrome c6